MSQDRFETGEVGIDSYDLGDLLPIEGVSTIAPGTNLLVSGPPNTGKQRLALQILAAGRDQEHAIAVTPDTDASRLEGLYDDTANYDDEPFYIVDCTGASGRDSADDTETVKYVDSPGDLTAIGIGIVKCTREIGDDVDDGLRLTVLSLSTLLRYSNANRMFNFLHKITGRVSAADYLGVGTIDPTMHDTEDVNTLTSLFDTTVELREADDGRLEGRVVGHPDADRTWQPF